MGDPETILLLLLAAVTVLLIIGTWSARRRLLRALDRAQGNATMRADDFSV